jgi:hypothetical protein
VVTARATDPTQLAGVDCIEDDSSTFGEERFHRGRGVSPRARFSAWLCTCRASADNRIAEEFAGLYHTLEAAARKHQFIAPALTPRQHVGRHAQESEEAHSSRPRNLDFSADDYYSFWGGCLAGTKALPTLGSRDAGGVRDDAALAKQLRNFKEERVLGPGRGRGSIRGRGRGGLGLAEDA